MTAEYKVQGAVAVITLNNPPVNGLGVASRQALAQGLEQANADPAVQAIVLAGAGEVFSGGADIKEFGRPEALQEPNLHTLIRLVEYSQKPVVAALHGTCMGGGLELSLGCHYRIAAPGTRVALPEVKLGLLPGAGGTQRLPRALGVEAALNMIVSGETVASDLLAMLPGQRLFDRISASRESLAAEALTLAQEVGERHQACAQPLPLVRDLPCSHPQGEAYFGFVRTMVQAQAAHFPAPLKCIEAVQAATLRPLEAGLEYERELFLNLMWTPESRALRHAFFAERAAGKLPDLRSDTPLRAIRQVGIVGAGTMGTGISINFLNAGLPVVLREQQQSALDHGLGLVQQHYAGQVKKGRLKPAQAEQRLALLQGTLESADLHDCDLIIEAVYEDLQVKQAVFEALDRVAKPGAILASNTSTLDINRIAGFTSRPQDVVGMHFFSPANVMRLLEVVRGEHTSAEVLASVIALAKKINKTAVIAGVCDGFIGNRMIEQYVRQAGFLLDEGASPQQVDRAAEAFGWAMGPFRMSDLAGNDIGWAIRQRRALERPEISYSRSADRLCELGRFGQKTGAGWYDYPAGQREPQPSPVVAELLAEHRRSLGLAPREIGDAEIVQRLVLALVNEGAHILEEGIAARASDIDMVYLTGYGFPLWRGGPMHYASELGLPNVLQSMQRLARGSAQAQRFWQPAPLLARLAAEGKSFS